MIKLKNISLQLNNRTILRDITATWSAKKFHLICGVNGSGKTSLLKCIAGLLAPSHGQVVIDGVDVTKAAPHKRFSRLGWVPAQQSIEFSFLARDVLSWQNLVETKTDFPMMGYTEPMRNAIERMEISHILDKPMSRLSLGEQKRVHLARVIGGNSSIILLDEPTSSLDPSMSIALMEWLRTESLTENGRTIIATSHDIHLARKFGFTLAVMDSGCLVAQGIAHETVLAEGFEKALKLKWDESNNEFIPCR